MKTSTPIKPFMVIPPGEFIHEEMEIRDWNQSDLANILGVTSKHISKLLSNDASISYELAMRLGCAFGQSPEYWINLEQRYKLSQVEETNNVANTALIYNHMPISEMSKLGWLSNFKQNYEKLAKAVCDFWEMPTLNFDFMQSVIIPMQMHSSEARKENFNPRFALTWLQQAKICMSMRTPLNTTFNKDLVEDLALRIPEYSLLEDGHLQFIQELNACGVHFLVLPHLKNTYLDGAVFWHGENPVVAYTQRFKRLDHFWFIMAHELGHICLHMKQGESILESIDHTCSAQNIEDEANTFAYKCLCVEQIKVAFSGSHFIRKEDICWYANSISISPALVVGVLHYNDILPYNRLARLKSSLTLPYEEIKKGD